MNLVDSSGWLEYFSDSSNAGKFAPAIEKTNELIVSTINLFEVYKKVLSLRNENSAKQAIGLMLQGRVIEVNSNISLIAARLSCNLKIPMADSIIYTTARQNDAIMWTQDSDFRGLEGVRFFSKK